ncbi:hypothetical protein ITJ57_04425 [Plantibacter sp. VKM Ac-2880]|uniref:hypothetical protein n=1 Tax=Plantibacter sp. VKM Ac-2880 TaxID=2783827 RepID=UPI0018908827|nr:hypothetical protein [Plantibacter sp. VKM Ac-2880]MBF4568008.1 hypothetical protein [Plantibacter sp. VKM Ac-2880]
MSGLGGIDEVFNPGAFEAKQFLDAEQRLPAPAPLAGDPVGDIYGDEPIVLDLVDEDEEDQDARLTPEQAAANAASSSIPTVGDDEEAAVASSIAVHALAYEHALAQETPDAEPEPGAHADVDAAIDAVPEEVVPSSDGPRHAAD